VEVMSYTIPVCANETVLSNETMTDKPLFQAWYAMLIQAL